RDDPAGAPHGPRGQPGEDPCQRGPVERDRDGELERLEPERGAEQLTLVDDGEGRCDEREGRHGDGRPVEAGVPAPGVRENRAHRRSLYLTLLGCASSASIGTLPNSVKENCRCQSKVRGGAGGGPGPAGRSRPRRWSSWPRAGPAGSPCAAWRVPSGWRSSRSTTTSTGATSC